MDDLATNTKFAKSLRLPFPLLSDVDGEVARYWGVKGDGYARRVTFVIDVDGKVTDVIEGQDALDPGGSLMACRRPKR